MGTENTQRRPADMRPMTETDRKTFGQNLAKDRKAAGLTQTGLAERMADAGHPAWKQNTVTRVELARRQVSQREIRTLEQIVGTNLRRGTTANPHATVIRVDSAEVFAEIGRLTEARRHATAAKAAAQAASEAHQRQTKKDGLSTVEFFEMPAYAIQMLATAFDPKELAETNQKAVDSLGAIEAALASLSGVIGTYQAVLQELLDTQQTLGTLRQATQASGGLLDENNPSVQAVINDILRRVRQGMAGVVTASITFAGLTETIAAGSTQHEERK